MNGLLLSVLLASAPASAATPAQRGDDKRLWAECGGERASSSERIIAACTALIQSGREKGKDLGTAYYNRGTSYSGQGDKARAIADFSEAIRLNPADVDAYVNRGIAFSDQGEHQRALADLNEAIRLNPREESAWSARGDVHVDLDDLPRAIADYSEVIRLNPRDSDAYYNRGLSWRRQGEDDKALADYDESIRLNPGLSDAHNNRGYVYFRRGDLPRAIADYEQAVVLRPGNIEAQANLCWAMALRGENLDRARSACDAVLAKRDNVDTRVRRGTINYRQGRFREAWEDFDAAMWLEPGSTLARYGRGLAAAKLGKTVDAETDIAAAVSKQPDIVAEYARYGIRR